MAVSRLVRLARSEVFKLGYGHPQEVLGGPWKIITKNNSKIRKNYIRVSFCVLKSNHLYRLSFVSLFLFRFKMISRE